MPEIIVSAGALDGSIGPSDLLNVTELCRVTECDAFLSHSWHDGGRQKWNAFAGWCEERKRTQQRWPRPWPDKLRIKTHFLNNYSLLKSCSAFVVRIVMHHDAS